MVSCQEAQQGHGRTGANSAAVASALCTVHVHVEQTDEHHDMYFNDDY